MNLERHGNQVSILLENTDEVENFNNILAEYLDTVQVYEEEKDLANNILLFLETEYFINKN